MKNQIDQSTPFLAFYDLLRIRGIYAAEEKREKLRRGFRRAMALAAVLVGLLLPQGAGAAGLIAQKATGGRLQGGITHDFGSGSLLESGDNVRLVSSMDSNDLTTDRTIFKGTSKSVEWTIDGGELHSNGDVWFLNFGKLDFNGGTLDVHGLLAAAMSDWPSSGSFSSGDVFKDSVISGDPGVSGAILVAETVTASADTVVATKGMTLDGSTGNAQITVPSGGGTITFKGVMGDASVLKAGTVKFEDVDAETKSTANGTVNAGTSGTISGNFTQSGGEMTAGTVGATGQTIQQSGGKINSAKIDSVLTQGANGTIDAGTSALTLGSGSSLGGSVTAGSVSVGNTGTLTLTGNAGLEDTTVTAGTLKLDQAGTIELNKLAVGTLQGTADSLKATKTSAGELKLGTLDVSSLDVTARGAVSQEANTALTVSGAANVTAQNAAGTTKYNVTLTQANNTFGSIGATGANVSITESDGVKLNDVTATGTLTVNAGDAVTQSGAAKVTGATSVTVADGRAVTLGNAENKFSSIGVVGKTANTGAAGAVTIVDSDSTLALNAIRASDLTVTAAGNVTQSAAANVAGAATVTAQDSAGTTKYNVTLTQANTFGSVGATGANVQITESDAVALDAVSASSLTVNAGGNITQSGATTISDNGNVTLNVGANTITLSQGVSGAGTLTLTSNNGTPANAIRVSGGTVSAETIAMGGSAKTLSQSGGNITVSGGSFLASGDTFTQNSGTLTLSNGGGTVNAKVTQEEGGTIKSQNGALTFATAVENAGTIGVSGQNVTFSGDVTQSGSGKIVGNTVTAKGNIVQTVDSGIEAGSLHLDKGTSQEYKLTGGANKVETLYGTAKSIEIDNGDQDLTIGKTETIVVGGEEIVNKSGVYTTDGLTIKNAGAVTDAGSGVVNGPIKIDSSASVLLDDTASINVDGLASDGNVGLKADSIALNGNTVSGADVTIANKTAGTALALDGDIEATGDILVKSAGTLATGDHELSTSGGNIVLSGAGVTVDGSTLSAASGDGVGMTSSAALTVQNSTITAPTVILETTGAGALTVGDGVDMRTSESTSKDAALIVKAESGFSMPLDTDNRPSSKLTITKGTLDLTSDDPDGKVVDLDQFAYKTTGDVKIDFRGSQLALESEGNVTVKTSKDVTIAGFNAMTTEGGTASGSIMASDATDATGASAVTVSASGTGTQTPTDGLVGSSVTLTAGGAVTVAKGAKISSNADLDLKTAAGKDFTIEAGDADADPENAAVVESTAGSVSITAGGALNVAGNVKTSAKTISLKTEGDSAGGITLAGDVRTRNSVGNSATIMLSSKTGEIEQTGGTVVGYSVNAADQTIKQTGNGRIEAITTDTGITATKIEQTGGGLVAAAKIAGDFEQSGNGGTLTAYSANAITVTGKVTQNASNGKIGEVTDAGAPKQTVTLGSLDQDAGTVNATTLTLRDDSTSGGTITAGSIVVQTADETPVLKKLTQDGAGTITADSITASTVEQTYAGTATKHATIEADTINANFTQGDAGDADKSGAYASASAKNTANGITITGTAVQNQFAENATIGAAGQNVTLQGGATQVEDGEGNSHGKVLAGTLTLAGTGNDYDLSSAEGNAVSTVTGKSKSVTIHDGENDVALTSLTAVDGATVLSAKDVTIDGVTDGAETDPTALVVVTSTSDEGKVTDTANQTAATTVQLGENTDDNNTTVGSVMLKKGTGAITVNGINATGDVGIRNASITQNGAISGANVTLHSTTTDNPDTTDVIEGALVVGKNITATEGDILVHSASAVEVGAASLTAENGSIVVKGTSATIAGTDADNTANLTAKEIGVEATDGAVSLGNATFVATDENMDGVVLKSSGDMTIGAGVAAKTSATATENKAKVTISADGKLTMAAGNAPADGSKMTVTAKKLEGITLTGGEGAGYNADHTVAFDKFVYTEQTDGQNLDFKFTGSTLSLKNLITDGDGNVTGGGSVKVKTAGQDISIVKTEETGDANVEVAAFNVVADSDADTPVTVAIQGSAAGSDGIVAKDGIAVDGTAGAGTVTVEGTVSSTAGAVEITSGGAIDVAAGGKVETKKAGEGITLTTTGTGTAAGDIAVNGTVTSAGNLDMTSAKDIALAGTVSATAGKATLKAASGEVKQTAGTVSVKDLDILAKNISQSGDDAKSITATGATSLEAKDGSITLNATTGTGDAVAPANDFATISKAVAKNAITISDKNALTIAGAAGSADGTTATEGDISITAGEALTVTAAINAGGNATLSAKTIEAQKAVTAGKKATATATGADTDTAKAATFKDAVTGGTDVELKAASGTLKTDAAVKATAGEATLTAKTIAAGGTVTAGTKVTATATGADDGDTKAATFAGAVTGGTGVELKAESGTLKTGAAVEATAGDATLTAGTIDASAAAATITAADDKSVTATAGNGATFGAAVQGGSVALTANGGVLATKAVTATTGDATLKGTSVDAQDATTADNGLVSMTATAGTVTTAAVTGKNVAIEATAGVTEGGAVTATAVNDEGGDKFVHTSGGNIAINSDFSAENAVYKADDGAITIGDNVTISHVSKGLGLEGNNLTVDGTKVKDVKTLVVNSKEGNITITGKPDNVETFAVAADGALKVQKEDGSAVDGDFTFANGSVSVLDKTEAQTVSVDGLAAGKDLTVNITGDLDASGATAGGTIQVTADTATIGNATAGGAVTVDATTATIGNATANGGIAAVRTTTGDATVGNLSGTAAEVSSQNGNVVLTGTATARTGDANVTAANGTVTGGGNVNAAGAATVSTADNGGGVQIGNVTAGGQATVNGTAVTAGNVAGNGTEVTARAGDVNAGNIGNGGATVVTATGNVDAGQITGNTVDVTAGGNVTAGSVTGAAGTTVTTQNGGAIDVAGNLGQGGDTVVNANGAAVTAATLESGGLLDVNNAGAVNANVAAGGDAQIQAASVQAGNTQTGGNLVLEVGGDANVGQVAVGGDVNGNVGGVYTVAGGNVGTMGQGGDFTTGEFQLQGDLASGDVTMDAGTLQMDGNLDAGGAAVDITAGGGIQGGGVLTAGQLSLAGGAIGAAGAAFQVNTATLQNIAGTGIYLVDTAAGTIAINVIDASGVLDLSIPNAAVAGGGNVSAGGDMRLEVNQQFGTLANPVNISVGGTLTIDGVGVPLLHIVIDGTADPNDLTILYNAEGFAIWGNAQKGYQIIGIGPENQRLINRALAFTVNTPELKSKQGIFGDPAFIHTRMNVSDARAAANMDMLALNAVDFYDTWENVKSSEGRRALRKWMPSVDMSPKSLLTAKLAAQASEMETQPEIWVPGQTGAAPAPTRNAEAK